MKIIPPLSIYAKIAKCQRKMRIFSQNWHQNMPKLPKANEIVDFDENFGYFGHFGSCIPPIWVVFGRATGLK